MDTRIIAERNAQAQQRLLTAAETIAGRLGLLEPLAAAQAARHRDPQLALLFQREALAGLLEAVQAALIEPASVAAETASELDRLSQFILAHYPDEPGRGDPEHGETTIDVAIRLLTPATATVTVSSPFVFEEPPVIEAPPVIEDAPATKPGKPGKAGTDKGKGKAGK